MYPPPQSHRPMDPGQSHYLTKSTWKHRLVIKSAGETPILKQTSLLSFSKSLHRELSGGLLRTIPLTSGSFMLELSSAEVVHNLLNKKPLAIANIPLVALPPKPNITCSGVVHNVPLGVDLDQLRPHLRFGDGACELVRMDRLRNKYGNWSGAVLLTFSGKVLPGSAQLADTPTCLDIEEYCPPPLRCFNCQGFGHGNSTCKGGKSCARCAGPHGIKNCDHSGPPRCANCGGGHTTRFRGCPSYIEATKITLLVTRKGIPWKVAAQQAKREATTPLPQSRRATCLSDRGESGGGMAPQEIYTGERVELVPGGGGELPLGINGGGYPSVPTEAPKCSEIEDESFYGDDDVPERFSRTEVASPPTYPDQLGPYPKPLHSSHKLKLFTYNTTTQQ